MIKKIIDWIIAQEKESIDEYPALAAPMTEEFVLPLETAEAIMDTVIEWETDVNTIDSLEELLNKKFGNLGLV